MSRGHLYLNAFAWAVNALTWTFYAHSLGMGAITGAVAIAAAILAAKTDPWSYK